METSLYLKINNENNIYKWSHFEGNDNESDFQQLGTNFRVAKRTYV
jgi:hypothetical protein